MKIILSLVLVLVLAVVVVSTTKDDGADTILPLVNTDEEASTEVADDTEEATTKPTTKGASLDLSGTGLTKVPSHVFSQTNLVSLDLSNNQLDGALQAEVRHLSRLVTLDLSDNNFTGVPAEVGQLSELRYLDLSNNQLTGLPYELGNLQNLETLDLRGNAYAQQDLAIIRDSLPGSTTVLVD